MTSPGGSIIYLEDVTVDFDGFKALNGLNFFMDYKELRVVIGPNGAGKTTLLDVISGKVQPSAGRRGRDESNLPARPRRRHRGNGGAGARGAPVGLDPPALKP